MRSQSAALAVLLALASDVVAKDAAPKDVVYTYTTATITECSSHTKGHKHSAPTHHAKPTVKKPVGDGKPVTVQVQAPDCRSCGCDSCQYVHRYTTAYEAFCPTGITKQVYIVEETYSGIASKPSILNTDIPCGFTKEVKTCTTCGHEPITATITCPITDVAQPTGVWDSAPKGHEVEGNIGHNAAPAKIPAAHEDDKSKAGTEPVGPGAHKGGSEAKGGPNYESGSSPHGGQSQGSPGSPGSGNGPSDSGSDSEKGALSNGSGPEKGALGNGSGPEKGALSNGPGSGSSPGAGANSQPSSDQHSPVPTKVYTHTKIPSKVAQLGGSLIVVICFVYGNRDDSVQSTLGLQWTESLRPRTYFKTLHDSREQVKKVSDWRRKEKKKKRWAGSVRDCIQSADDAGPAALVANRQAQAQWKEGRGRKGRSEEKRGEATSMMPRHATLLHSSATTTSLRARPMSSAQSTYVSTLGAKPSTKVSYQAVPAEDCPPPYMDCHRQRTILDCTLHPNPFADFHLGSLPGWLRYDIVTPDRPGVVDAVPVDMRTTPWMAGLYIVAHDLPALTTRGFRWNEDNVRKDEGSVLRGPGALVSHPVVTVTRRYFLSDTGPDPQWIGTLEVYSRDMENLARFQLSDLGQKRVLCSMAYNRRREKVWSYQYSEPECSFNTICEEDITTDGWWSPAEAQLQDSLELSGEKASDSMDNLEDPAIEGQIGEYASTHPSLDSYKDWWTEDKEQTIRAPFDYMMSHPGKDFTSTFLSALDASLKIPPQSLEAIKVASTMLHDAALMIDDVQDGSDLRRGFPAAHKVYGVPQTINSANYMCFAALAELSKLRNASKAVPIFTEELLNLHRGQGTDMYWRDTVTCPSEDEYLGMVSYKTGSFLRLGLKLMQIESSSNIDFMPIVELMGLIYQIRDDLKNLSSQTYSDQKGFCEDLSEGKFSFLIIHSIRKNPSDSTLIDILKRKTTDVEVKRRAIEYMQSTGSFLYAQQALQTLVSRSKSLAAGLERPREELGKFLNILEYLGR
ncbi:Geranylgeranyl pyrophosphate synthase [Paramyrothecium foliicola]|nr:Geranylgeranyl pyrophosphate synthase [Paramyrothecium foliicola]